MPITVLASNSYQTMYKPARILMLYMQTYWREDKYVDFGVEEAEKVLKCSNKTALKAFNELEKREFIVMKDPSIFSSRTGGKTRTWQLTWMPFNWERPSKEWEKLPPSKFNRPV